MAATLERAFAADRGFDVPTVVLTTTELADIAEAADKVARQAPFAVGAHYVSILAEAPSAEAVATFTAREAPGERAVVRGRTVHLMLDAPERYHSSKLHGGFTAECASIFSAGLTGDVKGYDEGREAEGVVSFDGGERMDRSEAVAACSNRRTLNAVGMALLAMPGSLLFLVGFTRGDDKE